MHSIEWKKSPESSNAPSTLYLPQYAPNLEITSLERGGPYSLCKTYLLTNERCNTQKSQYGVYIYIYMDCENKYSRLTLSARNIESQAEAKIYPRLVSVVPKIFWFFLYSGTPGKSERTYQNIPSAVHVPVHVVTALIAQVPFRRSQVVFHVVAQVARFTSVSFVLDNHLSFVEPTESVYKFDLELVESPYIYRSSLRLRSPTAPKELTLLRLFSTLVERGRYYVYNGGG
jgi:hypothetical protein